MHVLLAHTLVFFLRLIAVRNGSSCIAVLDGLDSKVIHLSAGMPLIAATHGASALFLRWGSKLLGITDSLRSPRGYPLA